jgi:hypothetical protein
MNISMHNSSVGVYTRLLRNLAGILGKAEQWTATRGIDPAVILQTRLAPDMFPFVRQVQIMTDMAKGTCARLAGQTPPSYEDNEKSIPELAARVQKTIDFLEGLPVAGFDGSESRAISLKVGPPGKQTELNFDGLNYLNGFGTPNVYFHYATAYALLRHNGMELGKRDFVG